MKMTRMQVKERRIALEMQILMLIESFQDDTRTAVSGLDINRDYSKNPSVTTDVQINVVGKS